MCVDILPFFEAESRIIANANSFFEDQQLHLAILYLLKQSTKYIANDVLFADIFYYGVFILYFIDSLSFSILSKSRVTALTSLA